VTEDLTICMLNLGVGWGRHTWLRNHHLMCFWLDGHPWDEAEPTWQWPAELWVEVEP